MEVQLLRAPNGDVIFLEANRDFIDVLMKLLNAPLGSVLQSCSGKMNTKANHALLNLAESMPRLRDPMFNSDKSVVIPRPLELAKMIDDACQAEPKQNPVPNVKSCLWCLKNGRMLDHEPGMACDFCSYVTLTKSPETQHVTCRRCSSSHVISNSDNISDVVCPKCENQIVIYTYTSLKEASSFSKNYCASCVSSKSKLCTMVTGHCCIKCNSQKFVTCQSCHLCDICSVENLGFLVPGIPNCADLDRHCRSAFHPAVKFLLSNSLEVFESSSVKAIELMSSRVSNFDGIQTCNIQVTSQHIQQLVLRSLLGSQQVLTEVFQPDDSCETEQTEEGSEAGSGTTGSFELTFDSENVLDELQNVQQ